MRRNLAYSIASIRFDEHYAPCGDTRATTNFANLARGERRKDNLRAVFAMIDNRFNALAHWDNPGADRYSVELEIVTADLDGFPLIEILHPTILDRRTGGRTSGIAGNNFSSYVRDYDFSILLPRYNEKRAEFGVPEGFGDLHGALFRDFLNSAAYRDRFAKPPVIALSVSSSRTYRRSHNAHPVLGVEYLQDELSPTDRYFARMGLQVRFFMPPNAAAPLAFYFTGDLLTDHSNLELIATISTMETFQRIYRPEIYNANSPAGAIYRPSLSHGDHSATPIVYDREERSRLAVEQGRFAEDHFIAPYRDILAELSAGHAA